MRVPKMVKNGFNSGLPVSPVFEEDKIPKEIRNGHEAQSRPSIMKANKNRLKPISEQACALEINQK
jgi:hypothetical protein